MLAQETKSRDDNTVLTVAVDVDRVLTVPLGPGVALVLSEGEGLCDAAAVFERAWRFAEQRFLGIPLEAQAVPPTVTLSGSVPMPVRPFRALLRAELQSKLVRDLLPSGGAIREFLQVNRQLFCSRCESVGWKADLRSLLSEQVADSPPRGLLALIASASSIDVLREVRALAGAVRAVRGQRVVSIGEEELRSDDRLVVYTLQLPISEAQVAGLVELEAVIAGMEGVVLQLGFLSSRDSEVELLQPPLNSWSCRICNRQYSGEAASSGWEWRVAGRRLEEIELLPIAQLGFLPLPGASRLVELCSALGLTRVRLVDRIGALSVREQILLGAVQLLSGGLEECLVFLDRADQLFGADTDFILNQIVKEVQKSRGIVLAISERSVSNKSISVLSLRPNAEIERPESERAPATSPVIEFPAGGTILRELSITGPPQWTRSWTLDPSGLTSLKADASDGWFELLLYGRLPKGTRLHTIPKAEIVVLPPPFLVTRAEDSLLEVTGILNHLIELFVASKSARLSGLTQRDFDPQLSPWRCLRCRASGRISEGEGVGSESRRSSCPACAGQRFVGAPIWQVEVAGVRYPNLYSLTLRELLEHFHEVEAVQELGGQLTEAGLGEMVVGLPISEFSSTIQSILHWIGALSTRISGSGRPPALIVAPLLGIGFSPFGERSLRQTMRAALARGVSIVNFVEQ